MQLIINLPERTTVLASNRQRWAEVLADPSWREHLGKIETNVSGQLIMSPAPSGPHRTRQFRVAHELQLRLGGQAMTECPISTSDGVKIADSGWFSQSRFAEVGDQDVYEVAPEICVEVLSPRNTSSEMAMKRQLYFDAGAEECWICDRNGRMSYYTKAEPNEEKQVSKICPEFPEAISY